MFCLVLINHHVTNRILVHQEYDALLKEKHYSSLSRRGDERYLADALESVPLIKGDNVMVPYFGGRLIFQVIGVATPSADTALVTQKTVFNIDQTGVRPSYELDLYCV
jgi:hypothetical protein